MVAVLRGVQPVLPPDGNQWTEEEKELWGYVELCLRIKPENRPSINLVKDALQTIRRWQPCQWQNSEASDADASTVNSVESEQPQSQDVRIFFITVLADCPLCSSNLLSRRQLSIPQFPTTSLVGNLRHLEPRVCTPQIHPATLPSRIWNLHRLDPLPLRRHLLPSHFLLPSDSPLHRCLLACQLLLFILTLCYHPAPLHAASVLGLSLTSQINQIFHLDYPSGQVVDVHPRS